MFKSNKKNNKHFFILFISFGVAGIVLFFPVRIEEGYTCLFHLTFAHNNPVETVLFSSMHGETVSEAVGEIFTKEYIHNWAILWWLSIIIICIGSYGFIKKWNSKNDFEFQRMEDLIE